MSKPSVFISYSRKDEELKNIFVTHLKSLVQQGDITLWDDQNIGTGDDWYPAIQNALQKAMVGICLISADYLASDFINKEEIPAFMDRRKNEGMLIIPILVRPCPWRKIRWLKNIQIFPRNNISLEEIPLKVKREKALSEITEYIYEKINEPSFKEIVPVAPEWTEPENIDIDRLPVTGMELFGREKELTLLDEAWESKDTNIISFIAWGGVGKSTLINKWLEYMGVDNYKDAERVFAWSFYSQGTNEQVSSADAFIAGALSWFGDSDPTSGSAWDKGQRLAGFIRQKKTLLILDGMEPLQSSHKFEKGKIKDQGLAALIRSLARDNNGLCIITSRDKIDDIKRYEKKANQFNLEEISREAGRALLRVGGVKGTDKELEDAVEEFGNHALAVKLIPVFLQNIPEHYISDALEIPDLDDIPEEKGRQPRRVIEVIYKRFMNEPEGDLLKILGFFDRPADIAAIRKIIDKPVIKNLTDNIINTDEAGFLRVLNNLRNCNLIAQESRHSPDTIDCHPLIREHFGEKLEQQNHDGWKEAHARLYEYYKELPEKELPDNLDEMELLFAAVMHGCLAGRHQEAMNDVYWKRIRRGREAYTVHKLGAFGADLACLSCFFESLWCKPASGLSDDLKALVLNLAGYRLRAVGRLQEAVQPMKAGLEMRIKQTLWRNASIAAKNLCELLLNLGNVKEAEIYAKESIKFADQSGNDTAIIDTFTSFANILHQTGELTKSNEVFREAENMLKAIQPDYPYLYSFWNFKFCNLLLSQCLYMEVQIRIDQSNEWLEKYGVLLDTALEKLSNGRALMQQLIHEKSGDFSEAGNYLNQAVDGLREAGQQDSLPWGLLARATLSRHQEDFLKSWTDLDEAREIAEYGQMRLHITDYHLAACRNIKAQLAVTGDSLSEFEIIENGETLSVTKEEMQARFQEHLKEADRLVNETGYHRRDGEVEDLRITISDL